MYLCLDEEGVQGLAASRITASKRRSSEAMARLTGGSSQSTVHDGRGGHATLRTPHLGDVDASYSSNVCVRHQKKRSIYLVFIAHMCDVICRSSWSVRKPDNVLDLLDAWLPLLPEWILHNILEQIVLPALTNEVENWNPLTDTVPIHAWIHPWLPLMSIKFTINLPLSFPSSFFKFLVLCHIIVQCLFL